MKKVSRRSISTVRHILLTMSLSTEYVNKISIMCYTYSSKQTTYTTLADHQKLITKLFIHGNNLKTIHNDRGNKHTASYRLPSIDTGKVLQDEHFIKANIRTKL